MAERRTTPTKGRVKRAFIETMQERGLEKLSMSDIARRAGINRGTLYLHYTDKYDLLRQLEDEAIEHLSSTLFAPVSAEELSDPADLVPDGAILETLRYVREERPFFLALMNSSGGAEFIERVKETIGEKIFDEIQLTAAHRTADPDIPPEYIREVVLGGIVAAIRRWLVTGAREPAEVLARLVSRTKDVAFENLLG